MKKILYILLFLPLLGFGQLPTGSTAPDFTITDIDGNTHNLYDILDGGKPVLLDLFAVWCGPCWSFAESGVFEEFDALYGTNGDNSVFTISVESDVSTPASAISGGGSSVGDWTSLIGHTLADDEDASIATDYNLAYYPTIYLICPDRSVTEIGQGSGGGYWTVEALAEEVFINTCPQPVEGSNAVMESYNSELISCGVDVITPIVTILNMGAVDMTACTINTIVSGSIVSSMNWTGSLATFGSEEVTLADISANNEAVTFELVMSNDLVASDNSIEVSLSTATTTNSSINVEVSTAFYPVETTWEIRNSDGTVVASATYEGGTEDSFNSGGPDADMVHNHMESLANGCYTFTAMDAYGDGQTGYSGYGNGTDGSIVVTDGEGVELLSISGDWGTEQSVLFEIVSQSTGCTSTWADNYNAQAAIDDGSCELTACPYPNFFEYNPNYTIADGSLCLTLIVEGCTNVTAENYSILANLDDGTCVIYGCMNAEADNFSPTANLQDDSCVLYGCTNETADNYNDQATENDGSCIIYGCTVSIFPNFNPEATVEDVSCDMTSTNVFGCTDNYDSNYTPSATVDNGSCITAVEQSLSINPEEYYYAEAGEQCIAHFDVTNNSESELAVIVTRSIPEEYLPIYSINTTFSWGFNYPPNVNVSPIQVLIGAGESFDGFSGYINDMPENSTFIINYCFSVVGNPLDRVCADVMFTSEFQLINYNGCTDETAYNYDSAANTDDNSCIAVVEGCSDITYLEYNSEANTENGSCLTLIIENQCNLYIEEQIPLFLPYGWSMFGFTCTEAMDVVTAFSTVVESVLIVKDAIGNAYLPEWNFNGIGDLIYSRGYQIKTTEEVLDFSFCPTIIVSEESNSPQYQIGDLAEGGIVFYIDETGEHGLVAAMADLTEGSNIGIWGTPEGFEWGCSYQNVSGADGISIGTGYQNTLDIVAQNCQTQNGGITAAQATLNYASYGFTDWFLPSKEELIEMYNTIGNGSTESNIGEFETSDYYYYWSSSELPSNAWVVYFNNGSISPNHFKYDSLRVRAVRAF